MKILSWLKSLFNMCNNKSLPVQYIAIMDEFFNRYLEILGDTEFTRKNLQVYKDLIMQQVSDPYDFKIYHKAIREPFDYYQFGVDFIKPLIDVDNSLVVNEELLYEMEQKLAAGENVVLFGNHQVEAEPQVLSVLFEKTHPELVENMIFVSGERVLKDIIAAPMSLGRSLLCIYSKKHMDESAKHNIIKQRHNYKALHILKHLFSQGGKCIFVAPSGGRDRRGADGDIMPMKYDPRSVETFLLMAERAQRPTNFYSISFNTYDLLPPPENLQREIGERRVINRVPVGVAFSGGMSIDVLKELKGDERANYFWREMYINYLKLRLKG